MWYSRAYGVNIQSALPLPELPEGDPPGDIQVRLERLPPPPAQDLTDGCYFRVVPGWAYLYWDYLGAIVVGGGREIVVDPVPGAAAAVLRQAILGPGLALLLHQRGRLALHASGVALAGGAAAFLGHSGGGKSTTAAVLYARGHGLVADDVLALDFDPSGRPLVLPGFPHLRLSPEAADFLGKGPDFLATSVYPGEERGYRADRGFPQGPLPLRRIYVLAPGETPAIEALPPQEALIELVRHSYRISLVHPISGSVNFRQCARLVNGVPLRRLRAPRSLDVLPQLAGLVEEDLGGNRDEPVSGETCLVGGADFGFKAEKTEWRARPPL